MAIIMMVVAGFFTLCAVLSLFLLKQVSGLELLEESLWLGCTHVGLPPLVCRAGDQPFPEDGVRALPKWCWRCCLCQC